MSTKTINCVLNILRISFIVTFIGTIAIVIYCLFFPTSQTAIITGTIIILLLFACIILMLCYFYFDKEKSKRNNEAFSREQTDRLIKQLKLFRTENEELKNEQKYLKDRCSYLDKKFCNEAIKTDVLTKLIQNTFNKVLDSSDYGK